MPAAKFIPQRFQNFVLPQHRHAAKTYAILVDNSSKMSTREVQAFAKKLREATTAPSKEQVLRKKPGPKKHGPIARELRIRLDSISEPARRNPKTPYKVIHEATKYLDSTFGTLWWSVKHTTRDEYETCLAMAYAIALDEGV